MTLLYLPIPIRGEKTGCEIRYGCEKCWFPKPLKPDCRDNIPQADKHQSFGHRGKKSFHFEYWMRVEHYYLYRRKGILKSRAWWLNISKDEGKFRCWKLHLRPSRQPSLAWQTWLFSFLIILRRTFKSRGYTSIVNWYYCGVPEPTHCIQSAGKGLIEKSCYHKGHAYITVSENQTQFYYSYLRILNGN